MKNITTSVLGFDVPVTGVPETLSEAIQSAGGEANLVETFVNQRKFHNTNTEARAAVVEAIMKLTGVARKTVKVPSAKDPQKFTEKDDESEQQYTDRVRATMSDEDMKNLWSAIKDDVGVIEFKGQGEGRGAGGPRTTKTDLLHAEILLKDPAKWPQAVQMLTQKNPGLVIENDDNGTPKVESLANALKTNRARVTAEENAALGVAA